MRKEARLTVGGAEHDEGVLTRERVSALALGAATVVAVYISYLLLRPFLPSLAWALTFAVVAAPLYDFLARHVKSRSLAAVLSVVIVAVVVIGPAIFVGDRLVREALAGIEMMRQEFEGGDLRTSLERSPVFRPVINWMEGQGRNELDQIMSFIASRFSTYLAGSIWMVAEILITLFLLFYFFRDRNEILCTLRSYAPLTEYETNRVLVRVRDTIFATIYGAFTVAMVQGFLAGLMFWWLGLPAPLLWGVVMALLSVVPMLGSFVVWLPTAVYLALEGRWVDSLILAGWGAVAVGLVDNLLYPVLVGGRLRMHTVPVFIAIVGGVFLFGASGLILGPVSLALTIALLDLWKRRTSEGGAADAV